MNIKIFETVKNYSEMLNKIAFYNFIGGVILFNILYCQINEIQSFFHTNGFNYVYNGISLNCYNILIPAIITFLSRSFKLHDKISDLLRIREKYDVNYILIPIGNKIGFNNIERIKENRINLMHSCFYNYASTQENKCKISYHDVIMAIDQLSWYWVVIECDVLLFIALIFSIIFLNLSLILLFLLLIIISSFLLQILHNLCVKYTKNEVEDILCDKQILNEIKTKFDAIHN